MNPIEAIVSLLAPHTCLICKKEGLPLCAQCAISHLKVPGPTCYVCGSVGQISNPCPSCAPFSPIGRLFVASNYEAVSKDMVACLKFDRAKTAAEVIADWMHKTLPYLNENTLVSPVPTANKRVRKRGYDQAGLIARRFAKKRGLKYRNALRRVGSTRQVGASRRERARQLENAYKARKASKLTGKQILLIDDVLTTGATIEAAARALNSTGVASVDAAVFAFSKPKPKNSSNTRSDSV